MARTFGEIPGIPPGTEFASRRDLAAAGVHRPIQGGISGSASEGADSIVISGGYEDDEDRGETITYTGHGGNDPASDKQIADQALTRGNRALAVSADEGLPVRVVRGANGNRTYSPQVGYRYDGLFFIERYWQERGKSGFNICRYRLVQAPPLNATTNPPPAPAPGSRKTGYSATQRVIRNTAVTTWVKDLYDHRCQVCRLRLVTSVAAYAEGAHLRPVGRPHDGPDAVENVLCLCPNHHVLLDRGAIGLDDSLNVVDLLSREVICPLTLDPSHKLGRAHVQYHREMFRFNSAPRRITRGRASSRR